MTSLYLILQTATPAPAIEGLSYGWLFAKMLIAMAIILVLAFVSIRYLMPKMSTLRGRKNSAIQVLDYQPLEARKSLYIVKIENKKVALGVTDQAITMLVELDAKEEDV